MAVTVKQKYDTTGSTQSVTGTPRMWIIGPPAHGGQARGMYICESGRGTTSTFRWSHDEPIDKTATVPSAYSAHSL